MLNKTGEKKRLPDSKYLNVQHLSPSNEQDCPSFLSLTSKAKVWGRKSISDYFNPNNNSHDTSSAAFFSFFPLGNHFYCRLYRETHAAIMTTWHWFEYRNKKLDYRKVYALLSLSWLDWIDDGSDNRSQTFIASNNNNIFTSHVSFPDRLLLPHENVWKQQ